MEHDCKADLKKANVLSKFFSHTSKIRESILIHRDSIEDYEFKTLIYALSDFENIAEKLIKNELRK